MVASRVRHNRTPHVCYPQQLGSAGLVDSELPYDAYMKTMCGRIIQASGPLRHQLVDGLDIAQQPAFE